jgi:hypothetical protein
LRDWIAAAALFAATAGAVLLQNAHVAVLFDLSYILNTAERIALGQAPYRDFPLAHAPLTFLIQAAIIRLTGRVFFHHVLYVAVTGGLGTVLAWRIALALLRGRVIAAWTLALLLATPLIFLGIYCIVPTPEYDCDCGFWLIVALWMFERLDRRRGAVFAFAAGALACVPLFFKQNMGLPFLLAAMGAVVLVLVLKRLQRGQTPAAAPHARSLLAFIAGTCATLLAALSTLHRICRAAPTARTQPHARRLQRPYSCMDAALRGDRPHPPARRAQQIPLAADRRLRSACRAVSLHARLPAVL